MRLVALSLVVCVLLAGCHVYNEMKEDCERTGEIIQAEFGGKVEIGWSWENGVLQYVNVLFVEPPEVNVDPTTLKARVVKIVSQNIRRKPATITVTF